LNLEFVKVENNLKLIQKQAEMIFATKDDDPHAELSLVKSKEGYLREPEPIIDKYANSNVFVSSVAANSPTVQADLKKATMLKPLLKQTIKNESTLKEAYLFLSDSAWLTYPAMDVDYEVATGKLAPDIRFQDYEFYSIADQTHDPEKTVKWTKPFQDISHWNQVISAAVPVYLPSGELRGVVGADFPIAYIKMKLDDIKFSEPHAFAFITDSNGIYITGQRNEPKAFYENQLINHTFHAKDGISQISLSGGNAYLLSTPIRNNGWVLNFVVPESDIIDPIKLDVSKETTVQILHFSQQLLLFLLIGSFVLILFSYRFSKTITVPLKNLTSALRESASGDFGKQIPVNGQDEIGRLTHAFNFMNSMIQQLMDEQRERALHLEDKIMDRTKELEDAHNQIVATYQKLKNSEELRSELIMQISHDLKTPLTSIKGYQEILMKYEETLTTEHKNEFMNLISLRLNHMVQLINDLFDITALDINEMHFEKEWIPFDFLLEHCLDMVIMNTPEQTVTVLRDYQGELPLLFVDPKKMNRALVNILENAIKYSAKKDEIVIEVKAYQQDGDAYLQIKDNGIGISKENLEKIFTPYFRDQKAKDEKIMGSGLGITIAQKIIQAHQGDILVESEVDVGTMITIRLPEVP
jgi:signal transduction histidine kinase